MSDQQADNQLSQLLADLTEGELSAGGRTQLLERMRRDPQARSLYFRHMMLHAGLIVLHAHAKGDGITPELPTSEVELVRRRPFWGKFAIAALLAFSGAVLYGVLLLRNPVVSAPPVRPIAVLIDARDPHWDQPTITPVIGGALQANSAIRLKSGQVTIEFQTGAMVDLEGPAELIVVGPNSAFLTHGKLVAQCPPSALNFTVDSAKLRAIDLSTRFGMVVDDHQAQVHVLEGAVVAATSTGEHHLQAGKAVSVASQQSSVVDASVDPFTFASTTAPRPEYSGDVLRYSSQPSRLGAATPRSPDVHLYLERANWQPPTGVLVSLVSPLANRAYRGSELTRGTQLFQPDGPVHCYLLRFAPPHLRKNQVERRDVVIKFNGPILAIANGDAFVETSELMGMSDPSSQEVMGWFDPQDRVRLVGRRSLKVHVESDGRASDNLLVFVGASLDGREQRPAKRTTVTASPDEPLPQ